MGQESLPLHLPASSLPSVVTPYPRYPPGQGESMLSQPPPQPQMSGGGDGGELSSLLSPSSSVPVPVSVPGRRPSVVTPYPRCPPGQGESMQGESMLMLSPPPPQPRMSGGGGDGGELSSLLSPSSSVPVPVSVSVPGRRPLFVTPAPHQTTTTMPRSLLADLAAGGAGAGGNMNDGGSEFDLAANNHENQENNPKCDNRSNLSSLKNGLHAGRMSLKKTPKKQERKKHDQEDMDPLQKTVHAFITKRRKNVAPSDEDLGEDSGWDSDSD